MFFFLEYFSLTENAKNCIKVKIKKEPFRLLQCVFETSFLFYFHYSNTQQQRKTPHTIQKIVCMYVCIVLGAIYMITYPRNSFVRYT